MLWTVLKKLIITVGRWEEEFQMQKSDYIPNPKGHWVDKGLGSEECWEWVEPESEKLKLYVTILKVRENEFNIVIDDHPHQYGLDCIDCTGKREAEICAELLAAGYSVYGHCIISDRKVLK